MNVAIFMCTIDNFNHYQNLADTYSCLISDFHYGFGSGFGMVWLLHSTHNLSFFLISRSSDSCV